MSPEFKSVVEFLIYCIVFLIVCSWCCKNRGGTANPRQLPLGSGNTQQDTEAQQALRSQVVKLLFPKKANRSQLMYDTETNTFEITKVPETSEASCSICLEEFEKGDLILSGLCKHSFHRECVMTWVERNDSCPVCRQALYDEATYKALEKQIVDNKETKDKEGNQNKGEEKA